MLENGKNNGEDVLDETVLQIEGGSGISIQDLSREISDAAELLSIDVIRPEGMSAEEIRFEMAKGIAPLVRKLPQPERGRRIKQLLMDAAETLRNAKKTPDASSNNVIVITVGPDEPTKVTSVPGGVVDSVKSTLRTLFSAASRAAM